MKTLAFSLAALVAAVGIATCAFAAPPSAAISLYTSGLQAVTPELGFRVTDASVKDRHLNVVGELVNSSRDTFNDVQLVFGLENGGEQRFSTGRLVPGASQQIQVSLPTESDLKPAMLRVSVADSSVDRSPSARRGR